MKNIFPGYSRKSEQEIKKIWEKGILIFDANVLLNLYRYSNATRNTILDLISKFQRRIWLPHQVALEYNRNRYEVISDQEKAYKEFTNKITQIQNDLQSPSKPPFLSNSVHKDLNKVFEKVNSEVEESIKKYCNYLKDDPIYERLSELFNKRITKQYNEDRLSEIFKEGEKRYKLKIPPGYEDEKNKEGNRKYGDLVLWKQLIDKAKEENTSVIFITDERKTDWWWKIKDGRNMGPRQELVEEINREAKVDFHMFSSERFLSYGQSFLEEQVNQKALEEIQTMKRAEMEQLRKIKRINEKDLKRDLHRKEELNFFRNRYSELTKQIHDIIIQQETLKPDALENIEVQEYLHDLSMLLAELKEEKNMLKNRWEKRERERELEKDSILYKNYIRDRKFGEEDN